MKIICIGMNYAKHVDELHGMDFQRPDEPVIFLKPDSSILRVNTPFYIPDFADEFHYETEIVVKINRLGRAIDRKFAHRYYSEVGIGIDFTARDLQRKLMSKGLPWELSKGFDQSAAISEFIPLTEAGGDIQNIDFHLDIDGETRQHGNTRDMLFKVDEIIAYVSQFFTLKMGDLIYTGTPEGVGKVCEGQRLQAYIGDRQMMDFLIK
ncbi:MAG: fumarylacetoacetate hydrolase family protein [Bacteroidales bacterium]|nr:fumarylacetoacetate hydrolase family protein [Bacteroidales bacterium]